MRTLVLLGLAAVTVVWADPVHANDDSRVYRTAPGERIVIRSADDGQATPQDVRVYVNRDDRALTEAEYRERWDGRWNGEWTPDGRVWNGTYQGSYYPDRPAIADDRGERSILLSWPSYDLDWCEDALHAIFPGQNLALVGEGYGGCTGTDRMFEILEEDFVSFSRIGGAPRPGGASFKEIAQKGAKGFARFPGINDRLKFYRKK